jgi:hypothetical protein
MGFSKKYPSGSLQLAMGKIQTLWWPITNIHQESFLGEKKWLSWGVESKKLKLLPMK